MATASRVRRWNQPSPPPNSGALSSIRRGLVELEAANDELLDFVNKAALGHGFLFEVNTGGARKHSRLEAIFSDCVEPSVGGEPLPG